MKKLKTSAPLGASLILISSVFYASYGIWTKLMGNFFGGYTASALRSVMVLLILVPIALIYRRLGPLAFRRNWKYLAVLLIASLFIWGPLYFAILHAGIGVGLAINYACIVFGMFVFGSLFAGEQFTMDKLISASLGLIGLYLIFSPSVAHVGWLALVAAAVSGLATAVNMVVMRLIPYPATQSTVILWTVSVLANVPMALIVGEAAPAIGWHVQWVYLVIFSFASVLASWLFVTGMKHIDAGAAGVLGLMEIVFGIIFGVLFFHEHLSLPVLLGATTIIVGAAIPYLEEHHRNSKKMLKV